VPNISFWSSSGVLVGFLAFALGQDDQRPQHHQQGHAVARKPEIIVLPHVARAEHLRLDIALQGQCHVVGIDVIEQLHAAGGQARIDFGAELLVRQRALDHLVVAAQGLVRHQARDQDLGIVTHRTCCFLYLIPG
jgi:hypothetical protein